MADLLRGNFTPHKPVRAEQPAAGDLTTEFEREALRRLGGSICFVAKGKFVFGEDEPLARPADQE